MVLYRAHSPALRRRILYACLAASILAVGPACGERAASAERPDLRDELIELGRVDQQVRESLTVNSASDTLLLKRMMRTDSANTQRLREIVADVGWPGKSMVGEEAARAAFLIVQHSPLHEFQKEMLELLRAAAGTDEAQRSDVAMLTDRVLTHEGKPQLYGTQFQIRDGRLVPYPIEEPALLDQRRAEVGLAPMAEYVTMLRQTYQGPVDFDTVGLSGDTTAR